MMWDAERQTLPIDTRVREELDRYRRYFNRLDAAISRHRQSGLFATEADDALHTAHDKILQDAHNGRG